DSALTVVLTPGLPTEVDGFIGDGRNAARDVDLYQVNLLAYQELAVDVDARTQGPLDAALRIFNAAGVELAANDDGLDPATRLYGTDPALVFTAPAEGTYYVGVSGFPNLGYDWTRAGSGQAGSTGAYRLWLTANNVPVVSAWAAAPDLPEGGPPGAVVITRTG